MLKQPFSNSLEERKKKQVKNNIRLERSHLRRTCGIYLLFSVQIPFRNLVKSMSLHIHSAKVPAKHGFFFSFSLTKSAIYWMFCLCYITNILLVFVQKSLLKRLTIRFAFFSVRIFFFFSFFLVRVVCLFICKWRLKSNAKRKKKQSRQQREKPAQRKKNILNAFGIWIQD